ncbi:MAG TPA: sialic acid TRAP transporter substrate-binding protein SiaP [Rhizobiaceae bacterium]|nr:sialic acid TRAP transporter substrate-binding protein SiaP [Rhizobiaceae bacterium]
MISRRQIGKLFACAAMVLASTGISSAQEVLRWAHVFEVTEPYHTETVWAAEEIGKRTNGRYKIEVYPSSQLGKEVDLVQGLTLGTVDIVILSSALAAKDYPPIGVTYYPFTFRNADHLLAYTKSDTYKKLAAAYAEKMGNQIVATTYYGTRHTTANKPIEKCSDLNSLKMRVPNIPAYLAMPKACGANTAPIAFAEVYLALQNGTVDAQENPLPAIEAKKLFEVQKYIALTGHIVDQLNTIVSKSRWASLSDEDKVIFTEVLQDAAARASKKVAEREQELLEVFKAKGLTITEVDKEDFKRVVAEKVSFEDFGYDKADWDAIQALK